VYGGFLLSDDTRCCVNTIWPEDEQDIARNMYIWRIVINVLKFVHQVGHWLRFVV